MGVFKKLRSIGLLMPIVQKSTISWPTNYGSELDIIGLYDDDNDG